jgi:hypothetical protein
MRTHIKKLFLVGIPLASWLWVTPAPFADDGSRLERKQEVEQEALERKHEAEQEAADKLDVTKRQERKLDKKQEAEEEGLEKKQELEKELRD